MVSEIESMKIAHIDTERTWRGGEQQALSLVEGLARRGHQNVVAARPDSPFADRVARFAEILPVSPWSEWALATGAGLRGAFARAGVEVVHAHTGHAVALAALATAGTRLPVVITRRVDFPIGRNPLSRWKYRRAARLIAISRGVRDVLLSDGIPPDRIALVPSGSDFRRYENIPLLTRAQLGLPETGVIVGQVAALAPHKDQATFLAMIAALRARGRADVTGVLVGDGALRAELETEAMRLGVRDAVRFLGHRDDALGCVRLFDVFCFSSWAEGLGTSIIDAMALGVPVAATRVGGIPDLVEDGVTGFGAPPRDPSALADAVEKCLQEPARSRIVDGGKKRAREYSIDRTVDGTEAVYRAVLGR